MKVGVIQFPGTNCDRDVFQWLTDQDHNPEFLWHQDLFDIHSVEACVVPGGFSFGDYLRSGALASRSPVMKSVKELASFGKPVLGICNGFQILCEAGLLPGVLLQNEKSLFIDSWARLKSPKNQKVIQLPVAHGDGRFWASNDELKKIWDQDQVLWCYEENINGSVDQIAGVQSKSGNVKGLMPHPERAYLDWMGGTDGWKFWL